MSQKSKCTETKIIPINIILDDETDNLVKSKILKVNTPGTMGGSGGRDRPLAVKDKIKHKKIFVFCMYLLVIPKYWGKQIFIHGRFPEVGQKQKTEKKKKREKE